MNKLSQPKDVAQAIEFLISQNSNYITGTDLYVDGGYLSAAYTATKR